MTTNAADPPLVLRRSAGDRYGIAIMAALVLGAFAALAAATTMTSPRLPGFGVFLGLMALLLGAVAALVVREAMLRWRTRIVLRDDAVALSLPGLRGYVRAAPVERELPYAAIAAVETRLEAFRALGNTVAQRAYSLVLADGSRVGLGADRRMAAPFFAMAAEAIAARAGVPIRDLGAVDGRAGVSMLWGQTVPGWDAPPLSPGAAGRRVGQERRAWQLLWLVLLAAALAVALSTVL